MIKLTEKIEEVRRQPEHIRKKYVIGCVAASMLLIVAIWFFSITAMFKDDLPKNNETGSIDNLKEQIKDVNQKVPSIKDIGKQATGINNEGIINQPVQEDGNDLQYPLQKSETNDDTPQSSAYSTEN